MRPPSPKQNRLTIAVLGLVVLSLLVLLILFQSSSLWKSFSVETASDTLLLYSLISLNVAAFVIFGFIFLRSIVKLVRERRALELGSKIKSRLLFYFALVSLLPIIAMAVFSYLFMNRALDRWFTQIPENVVREAGRIQDRSNADHFDRLERAGKMLALIFESRAVSEGELQQIAEAGGLAFIEVRSADGRTVVRGGTDADVPELELARSGDTTSPLLSDGSGFDVAAIELNDGRRLLLGLDLRNTESVNKLFGDALVELDRLKEQQFTVRQIGLLTLGVLTFLLIFASSWTAFHIARGLTGPIKALAEGAELIAKGQLGHRVDVFAEDELALLVKTFNEMSARLDENAAELTERRRYIETVLLSLPTGVISIDDADRVTTINPAARAILTLEPADVIGAQIGAIVDGADNEPFARLITRARRVGHASDQLRFLTASDGGDGARPVSVTASALPEGRGVVLVMEDLSELIAAQRASAWQEVARRMAHEIKNPLTPIQLSAERIAKRFSSQSQAVSSLHISATPDEGNLKLVNDGTQIILREVESLKAMVDEFSRFARLPDARLEANDLNAVIRNSAELYNERDEIEIKLDLASNLPNAMIDVEQLKRVFVNLIDNAIEAPGGETARSVVITSRHEPARDLIVVELSDNGRGIEQSDFPKLFQPYFSTKGRGTGLGLAIVHRIMIEHRGRIKAVPNQPGGARFILEIPVAA